MKKIMIPVLLLVVAVVSIHCEAEVPGAVNATNNNAAIVGDSVITDTTVVDTIVTDTIYYPHDSIPVFQPGNPSIPDTTYIDSVYVPVDSVTGLRIKGRR